MNFQEDLKLKEKTFLNVFNMYFTISLALVNVKIKISFISESGVQTL